MSYVDIGNESFFYLKTQVDNSAILSFLPNLKEFVIWSGSYQNVALKRVFPRVSLLWKIADVLELDWEQGRRAERAPKRIPNKSTPKLFSIAGWGRKCPQNTNWPRGRGRTCSACRVAQSDPEDPKDKRRDTHNDRAMMEAEGTLTTELSLHRMTNFRKLFLLLIPQRHVLPNTQPLPHSK